MGHGAGGKKEEMKTMALAGTGIMNSSALPSAAAKGGVGYYGAGTGSGAQAATNFDSSSKPMVSNGAVVGGGQFGATTALGISPQKVGGSGIAGGSGAADQHNNKRGSEFKKSAQHILNR